MPDRGEAVLSSEPVGKPARTALSASKAAWRFAQNKAIAQLVNAIQERYSTSKVEYLS